ncbi:MAG: helix-turn-helix domain-containing protein [Phenylobacterium sp.]|uniref:MerR family transcriptional regulator n=1 Tax=Phenylobacterium sp. TaxID=1871053 RepID=UPI00271B01AE|nr:helix-turn-helix domain-containing protein [Phenylobacterium sp.]MDO8410955.1 helix-turn-helix domain-containing protein [Phenylobacterium sp.]
MMSLTIGKLAAAADVKVPTIRFYEQIGLLPEPVRTVSDRRAYDPAAVRRLAFIKHARQLGFPIEAIRTLLDLADHPERSCEDANSLAQEQLTTVETKIAQLEALRSELRRMVAAGCQGIAGDCRVIETLADHGLCGRDHSVPGRLSS